jgi:hypothetical protein
MYSDITIDLTWVTRLDAGILADLAETGRWLASRDGRLELVRLTPSIGGDQARDSSLSPADGLVAPPQSSYAGSVKENEEAYAVELVSVRLRERFPGLSPDEVDEVVATYHHQFDGRPIRDFVPILVERQARDHLRTFPRQRY